MPKSLTVTLGNLVYFEKAQLPQSLANRLIRLAAFQNPEFYKAQAMRMSVWDKPRVIGCAGELSAAHCPAARLPGCRAGIAERQWHSLRICVMSGTAANRSTSAFVGTLASRSGSCRRRNAAP